MKTLTALLTITLAANAYSVGEKPPPEKPNGSNNLITIVNTNNNSLVGMQKQEQSTNIGDTKTGDLTNNITISENHPNKLTIRTPTSTYIVATPGTAPNLKCIGGGGSNVDGNVSGWYCWIQRDAFALANFERLASFGLFTEAANAYCTQKLLRKPHGSKEKCHNQITQELENNAIDRNIVVVVTIDQAKQTCESSEKNTVIKEVQDDGLLYIYDCTEKEVIGKGQ